MNFTGLVNLEKYKYRQIILSNFLTSNIKFLFDIIKYIKLQGAKKEELNLIQNEQE